MPPMDVGRGGPGIQPGWSWSTGPAGPRGTARTDPSGQRPPAAAGPCAGARAGRVAPHASPTWRWGLSGTSQADPVPSRRVPGNHGGRATAFEGVPGPLLVPPRASYHARILQSSGVSRPEKPASCGGGGGSRAGSTTSLRARHFRRASGAGALGGPRLRLSSWAGG